MAGTLSGSSAVTVLERLLDGGEPQTRAELAAASGLSRPTVFAAIDRLERAGLVAPAGRRTGVPGRTATLYQVPPAIGGVAAMDLGGANIRVAVCDVRGVPLAEKRRATQAQGAASVIRQAHDLLVKTIAEAGVTASLLAVGVSLPGVVDRTNGVVRHAWNLGQLKAYDFQARLQGAVQAPILLENNVNLAAVGEQWQGAAQAMNTFAVVAVGAGVGAGIVHNGTLLRGAHGAAGEVAFLPLGQVHRRGSAAVEDDAGAVALLHEAHDRADWADGPPADVAELFARAAQGEQPAVDLVADECRRIAAVIAAICAVVDPEAVFLTGGVGGNELLIRNATELARQQCAVPPVVLPAALGERASLVGAIALGVERARATLLTRVSTGDAGRQAARARLAQGGRPESLLGRGRLP